MVPAGHNHDISGHKNDIARYAIDNSAVVRTIVGQIVKYMFIHQFSIRSAVDLQRTVVCGIDPCPVAGKSLAGCIAVSGKAVVIKYLNGLMIGSTHWRRRAPPYGPEVKRIRGYFTGTLHIYRVIVKGDRCSPVVYGCTQDNGICFYAAHAYPSPNQLVFYGGCPFDGVEIVSF